MSSMSRSPPTLMRRPTRVTENAIIGTNVGITADAFDLDATNNTITYSLTSNPDGLFTIDANTGVVTTAAAIDREVHGATRSITIQAESSDGSIAIQSFNINDQRLSTSSMSTVPRTMVDAATDEVTENVVIGTDSRHHGRTPSTLDATNNTITYSLTSNPDGLFTIDVNTGVVTTAAAIDRDNARNDPPRSRSRRPAATDRSPTNRSTLRSTTSTSSTSDRSPMPRCGAVNTVAENAGIGTLGRDHGVGK